MTSAGANRSTARTLGVTDMASAEGTAAEVLAELEADGYAEISSNELMVRLLDRGLEVDDLSQLFAEMRSLGINVDDLPTEYRRAKRRRELTEQAALIDWSDLKVHEGCSILATEERAISLAQLEQLNKHFTRRLDESEWTVSRLVDGQFVKRQVSDPEDISLYDLNEQLVLPCSVERQCSMVEILAKGPQIPDFFVSHVTPAAGALLVD